MAITKDGVELDRRETGASPGEVGKAARRRDSRGNDSPRTVTNVNFQRQVVFQWLFSRSILVRCAFC